MTIHVYEGDVPGPNIDSYIREFKAGYHAPLEHYVCRGREIPPNKKIHLGRRGGVDYHLSTFDAGYDGRVDTQAELLASDGTVVARFGGGGVTHDEGVFALSPDTADLRSLLITSFFIIQYACSYRST